MNKMDIKARRAKVDFMVRRTYEARIAELERERNHWRALAGETFHDEHGLRKELLVAEARCAAMREALGFALDCLTATPRADVYTKAFTLKAVRAALADDAGALEEAETKAEGM